MLAHAGLLVLPSGPDQPTANIEHTTKAIVLDLREN
jgi:hypothetical protein